MKMLFNNLSERICSRANCELTATKALIWQNPKIHTGARHKTWLACPEHLHYLSDFLETRGFLQSVIGVDQL